MVYEQSLTSQTSQRRGCDRRVRGGGEGGCDTPHLVVEDLAQVVDALVAVRQPTLLQPTRSDTWPRDVSMCITIACLHVNVHASVYTCTCAGAHAHAHTHAHACQSPTCEATDSAEDLASTRPKRVGMPASGNRGRNPTPSSHIGHPVIYGPKHVGLLGLWLPRGRLSNYGWRFAT